MTSVLVIEDNENNIELISFILESAGYEVLRAMTGYDGFKMAVERVPDFIIQDIQLPDITGDEVVKMLRDEPSTATIPVIAMTSYAMSGDKETLLASGCNGYIEKPIDPERILEQIETILKRFK